MPRRQRRLPPSRLVRPPASTTPTLTQEINKTPSAITETSTTTLIGCIGFTRAAHPDKRRALTLGYWLGEPWWGRGLMAEAAAAAVGWAFATWDAGDDRLERVEGCAYARNGASARVLEKAGFLFEGRKRAAETKRGEVLDLMVYGVTRGDWEGRRGSMS